MSHFLLWVLYALVTLTLDILTSKLVLKLYVTSKTFPPIFDFIERTLELRADAEQTDRQTNCMGAVHKKGFYRGTTAHHLSIASCLQHYMRAPTTSEASAPWRYIFCILLLSL